MPNIYKSGKFNLSFTTGDNSLRIITGNCHLYNRNLSSNNSSNSSNITTNKKKKKNTTDEQSNNNKKRERCTLAKEMANAFLFVTHHSTI